jgi:peptide/bleomycin uptake transporter
MLREYFWSRSQLRRTFAWTGLLIFIAHQCFRAWLKYAINSWYEVFYNVLQTAGSEASSGDDDGLANSREEVSRLLWQFSTIVAPAVIVNPLAGLIRNWWVLEWRLTLMEEYIANWNVGTTPIEGAAQRVHEDTQRFAKGIQSCISSVLEALMTLAIFCPVLYNLQPSLMGLAIAIAAGGLVVSVLVGKHLVRLEVQNQVVEAAVRKQLVVMEVDPAGLMDANDGANGSMVVMDASPASIFAILLRDLKDNYRRLYCNFCALATWLAAYEQAATIVPYAVMAPMLFSADPEARMTLGSLVKVSNAFGRVFDAVNIVSDRFLEINEWRSVLVRLREFEREMYYTQSQDHTVSSYVTERLMNAPRPGTPSPTPSSVELEELSPTR